MAINLPPNYTIEQYLDCLSVFLERRHLRKTYERYLTAETIYKMENRFTCDILKKCLDKQKCHVSRSTVYHTLNLLMEAEMIIKHNFSVKSVPQYEKVRIRENSNHVYVEDTDTVIDFSDVRIEPIIKDIEEKYNVYVIRHSFTIYCTNKEEHNK